jgi:DNA mismatch repair ATPase MutS
VHPAPVAAPDALSARGLYDAGLSLRVDGQVVGNDIAADGSPLVVITGANQGGKSTFLRSAGLAQLMMQCGMFVPAEAFRASIAAQVFTHYPREEDRTMQRGKLDEELHRISGIVDRLRPGCIVLLNESFASTNEGEGSQIAHGIVRALLESGVTVIYVTHLYDLAQRLARQHAGDALFLRAQRRDDGQRTYRLVEGAPLPTSYGPDLYQRIFGDHPRAPVATSTGGLQAP